MVLVDLRETYVDASGQKCPGRKGEFVCLFDFASVSIVQGYLVRLVMEYKVLII